MNSPTDPGPSSSGNVPRWNIRLLDVLLIVLLCGGIYIFYKELLLVHFYVNGAYILDSGWTASLIWRDGMIPGNPVVAVPGGPTNIMQTHTFLLMPFLSMASYLFPFPMGVWFSMVYGAFHALSALAAYFIFRSLLGESVAGRIGAFLSAALLMVSAVPTENLRYPHSECFWFLGASVVVLGLVMQRPWMTWLGVILAVATREDCGFHLAAPFLLVLTFTLLFPRFFGRFDPVVRNRYFFISLTGLLFSPVSIFIPQWIARAHSIFAEEYLGYPYYSHCTPAYVSHQALFFLTGKMFIWVPILILLVAGLIRRDVIFVSASFAYIPWLVVNLAALEGPASQIESYHVFPLFLTPLFACLPRPALPPEKKAVQPFRSGRIRVAMIAISLLTSIVLLPSWCWSNMTDDLFKIPSSAQIAQTERFYETLPKLRKELGTFIANAPAVALAPRLFSHDEGWPDVRPNHLPDSIVFFAHSWNSEWLWPVMTPEFQTYQISGTRLFVATRLPRESLPVFTTLAQPTSPLVAMMECTGWTTDDVNGITLGPFKDGNGSIYGPYVHLPSGRWEVAFTLQRDRAETSDGCDVDIYAGGKTFAAATCFTGEELRAEPVLSFETTPADEERAFEFRVFQKGQIPFHVSSIVLRPVANAAK